MSDTERKEELLAAERAADWLRRLQNGEPGVRIAFARWLRESPRNIRETLLATAYQHALRHMKDHHLVDVEALKKRCAEQLCKIAASDIETLAKASEPIGSTPFRLAPRERARWKIAAVIAFLAVTSLMTIAIQAVSDRTISTGASEWRTARLADGTVIRMRPQTRVGVDITDRERVLRLVHGGMMVYVAKDAARPFSVETDLAVARAIGTAFAVERPDAARVSITVKEGLVGVRRASDEIGRTVGFANSEPIVLRAGQRVQVTPNGPPLNVQAVDVDQELAWAQEILVFRGGMTLADAIREFNARNRIQIQLLDPAVAQQTVVGVFDAADPLSFAKTLELSLPLSVVDDHSGALLLAPHPATTAPDAKEKTEH